MTTSKSVFIPGAGEVTMTRNKLASRISIKVRPDKKVCVTLPWKGSFSEAETFLIQKQDWIRTASENMEELARQRRKSFVQSQKNVTLFHELDIGTHDSNQVLLRVANRVISVRHPSTVPPDNDKVQEAVKKGIDFAMKHEAKKYLHFRINELAQANDLHFNRLSIRDPKTRWGSCSSENNINLSYQLMRLPPHLIDYVILHELAHTIHKNHGKEFWIFLEKLSGNARKYAREMKQYSTYL